jgi:hypothetical protein
MQQSHLQLQVDAVKDIRNCLCQVFVKKSGKLKQAAALYIFATI